MSNPCEICGKEREGDETIVVSLIHRLKVCHECSQDYANHDYNKLISKLRD